MLKTSFISLPVLLFLACIAGLYFPASREQTLWLLQENRPVELLTFLFLMAGGIGALMLGRHYHKRENQSLIVTFFYLFGLLLLITGMEEISWGQHVLGFSTPESMTSINQQGEVNIHNLPGLHGKSEILRLFFGIGGLIGLGLKRMPALSVLRVSPLLLSWFCVITAHAAVDLSADWLQFPSKIDFALAILGWRTLGSSTGNGCCIILLLLSVNFIIISAISFTVISRGFPILTGSL